MKKLLICIFLIGFFAIGYSPPDQDVGLKKNIVKTECAQAVDQIQTPVIYVIDAITLPVPDTPAKTNWMTEISNIAVLSEEFELSGQKMYSSNNILTTQGKPFDLNQLYRPDKSLNSGQLAIRDKL